MTLSSVVEQSAVNRYVTSSNLVESVCTNLAQLGERRFYKPSVVGSSPVAPFNSVDVVELADTLDLESSAIGVRVRVSPSTF